MKKIFILFALFIFCLNKENAYCQVCPKKFIEAKYKIENSLKMSCDLSQEFTIIGMNKEALIEEDKFYAMDPMSLGNPKSLIAKDSNLKIRPAMDFVCNVLKTNDIVILNERHNYPQHRLFFYNILDSLQHYGFNSLFIETLSYVPNDSIYEQNNTIEDWGYYTVENIFHQVCGKLRTMKYKLYSYEVNYPRAIDTLRKGNVLYFINKSDVNWVPVIADTLILRNFFSPNDNIQREAEQALNIYNKIVQNKIQKVFIYCGYSHAFKDNVFMAGMLKHLLKRNVYSIDQIYLHEHSEKKYENPLFTKYGNVKYPFVLVDKQNNALHTVNYLQRNYATDTLFDAAIASPRSIYINNRPTWLELNGERKRYRLNRFIDISSIKDFLVIITDIDTNNQIKQIKNKHETTPADIFQVFGNGSDYDAILRPNKEYNLKVYKDSKVIIDKTITTNE